MDTNESREGVLEVGGKLTLGELRRFQYFGFRRAWWLVVPAFLVTAVLAPLMGVDALFNPDNTLTRSSWIPPLVLLLFWGAVLTTPYRSAKRLMRTSTAFSGPVTYAFGPDRVRYRGDSFSSEVAYSAIWMVQETKTQYLIYPSSASALVLPKRYFRDAAELSAWRTLIEEKIAPKKIEAPGFLARRL